MVVYVSSDLKIFVDVELSYTNKDGKELKHLINEEEWIQPDSVTFYKYKNEDYDIDYSIDKPEGYEVLEDNLDSITYFLINIMKTNITFMQRMLLVVVGLVCTVHVSAYDFKVENDDGVTIYYHFLNNKQEVEVVSGDDPYSGDINLIPSVVYGEKTYPVTKIASNAFKDCLTLKTVSMPESITEIGVQAFLDCISLTSVQLSESLKTIGSSAFKNCSQ